MNAMHADRRSHDFGACEYHVMTGLAVLETSQVAHELTWDAVTFGLLSHTAFLAPVANKHPTNMKDAGRMFPHVIIG